MKTEQSHGQGFRIAALLSPAALRIELLGIVAFVLVLGRISLDFGRALQQFSQLLFR
jgi:hypothetical protein